VPIGLENDKKRKSTVADLKSGSDTLNEDNKETLIDSDEETFL